MTIKTKELAELTAQISAAALDTSKWKNVLKSLHIYSEGVKAQLSCRDIKTGKSTGAYAHGFDPHWVDLFHQHFHSINPWTPGYDLISEGAVTSSQSLCSHQQLINSEFYNDWLKPQEDILYGASLLLIKEGHRMITLSGNVRKIDGDTKEQEWMSLIGLIAPHMRQALEINKMLDSYSLEQYVARNIQEKQPTAIFILSYSGKLTYSNTYGSALLEEADVIKINSTSSLQLINQTADKHLAKTFYLSAKNGHAPPSSFPIAVNNYYDFDAHTLNIDSHRLTTSPYGSLLTSDQPTIILTLYKVLKADAKLSQLANIEKLTDAEKAVVLLFHKGDSLRDIAQKRSTSIHTVRCQFKSSMAKLKVSCQAQLIRLLNEI